MSVTSSTGNIYLQQLDSSNLSITTSTGDIDLEEHTADHIEIITSTGEVSASQIVAEMKIESSTGDVTLQDVEGAIALRTSTGSVEFYMAEINKNIKIETSTGDVNIFVDKAPSGLQLDFSASTGDTTADLPNLLFEVKNDHDLRGKVGTGGPLVQVITSTGDVHIEQR
jgi:lia operon protein LiaG